MSAAAVTRVRVGSGRKKNGRHFSSCGGAVLPELRSDIAATVVRCLSQSAVGERGKDRR